jgi:hypothetical protein
MQTHVERPRTGRFIWTGALERRGVVEIEGTHASRGVVTGGLPGYPVRVRVSPAQFGPKGLVVYSMDAALNNQPRHEEANRANGWNSTTWEYSPDRAREVVVLEEPSAANGFNRLAIRNDARTCSVIIVEWSAL